MLCDELGYDVLALTETHDTGKLTASRRFVVGEPARPGKLLLASRCFYRSGQPPASHTVAALGRALSMCDCEPPPTTCSSYVEQVATESEPR